MRFHAEDKVATDASMTCTAEVSSHAAAGEAQPILQSSSVSTYYLEVLSDLLALANMHVWLPLSENLADDVPINQSKDTEVYYLH